MSPSKCFVPLFTDVGVIVPSGEAIGNRHLPFQWQMQTYWIGWLLLDGKSRWHSVSMGVAAGCEGRLGLYRTKLQMSEWYNSANSGASGLPQAALQLMYSVPYRVFSSPDFWEVLSGDAMPGRYFA